MKALDRVRSGRCNVVPNYSKVGASHPLVDFDFLGTETGAVRASARFRQGRKLRLRGALPASDGHEPSSTSVEPARFFFFFTTTGMNADHRLRLPAQDVRA